MRIAIDLRPLIETFESGVSVYTKALIHELQKNKKLTLDLFYQSREKQEHIHALFPKARHLAYSNTHFHLKSLFRQEPLPKGYFKKKPELIWIPDRRPFYKTDIPLVMTIHDLIPENRARSLSWKSWLWHKAFPLKKLLKQCDGVLSPSLSTAMQLPRDLMKEVSYEGAHISKTKTAPAQAKAISKRPFFLSISPADPRKRLHWVLKIAQQFPKAHFVIAGLKKGDKRFAHTKLKKQANCFLMNHVTEEEKAWLLKKATALLALSKEEGFDLPILEAMKAKCPVIMSDIAVHRELYQGDFVKDETELVASIHRALQGKGKQAKARGDYNWEKAAKRSLLFFRRVIRHKNR